MVTSSWPMTKLSRMTTRSSLASSSAVADQASAGGTQLNSTEVKNIFFYDQPFLRNSLRNADWPAVETESVPFNSFRQASIWIEGGSRPLLYEHPRWGSGLWEWGGGRLPCISLEGDSHTSSGSSLIFWQLAYGFKHSSTLLCYISWSSGYRQIQILKSDHLVGQSPSNTGVGSSHLRGQPPPPAFTASVLGEHWNHLSTALLCMSTYCCLSNETQLSSSIHLKGRFEGTFPSASESQNNLFLFVLRAEML